LVGWVSANRRARIALDVIGDELYERNALLPDTRSEAALPLRVGQRLLGVLDVQSGTPNAFNQADIDVLQTLADQIAVALENGRLFARQQRTAQLEQRVAELTARLHRSLTVDAILEHAASDLGQAFGAPRVVVRLQPDAEARLAGGEPAVTSTPARPATPASPPARGNGHSAPGQPGRD
jgi:GAF domain-containing protein